MSSNPTPATHPTDPGQQAEDTGFYRQVLHDFITIGADLARTLHQQATTPAPAPQHPKPTPKPPATPLPEIIAAFDRLARAVRRSILLARSLATPPPPARDPAAHRTAARKQVIRAVEDAIQRASQHAHDAQSHDAAEALTAELHDRLDAPDLDDDLATRPIADIITEIRRDLGLASPPGDTPGAAEPPPTSPNSKPAPPPPAAPPNPVPHRAAPALPSPPRPRPQRHGPLSPARGQPNPKTIALRSATPPRPSPQSYVTPPATAATGTHPPAPEPLGPARSDVAFRRRHVLASLKPGKPGIRLGTRQVQPGPPIFDPCRMPVLRNPLPCVLSRQVWLDGLPCQVCNRTSLRVGQTLHARPHVRIKLKGHSNRHRPSPPNEPHSSKNSAAPVSPPARRPASNRRNSTRLILPEIVFGNSKNSIRFTRLYGASRARKCAKIAAAVPASAAYPSANATNAFGNAVRVASGEGTTAASATAGCSISTLSNSNGLIRYPELLNTSSARPTYVSVPSAFRIATSPVRYQAPAGARTDPSSCKYPCINPNGAGFSANAISPSSTSAPSASSNPTRYPGNGRPMLPASTTCPGVLAICSVVSVCPYPSRMPTPQASRTRSITSGFNGSPAATASRNTTRCAAKSSCTSIRHTVGGAQNVVTPTRPNTSSNPAASNRPWFKITIVAPAFQGANTLLQACFAHPGDEMFR